MREEAATAATLLPYDHDSGGWCLFRLHHLLTVVGYSSGLIKLLY